jgi:hypothetical protein
MLCVYAGLRTIKNEFALSTHKGDTHELNHVLRNPESHGKPP